MFCVTSANARSYKVGDYYEENGLKGIVVRVDATGEHGLLMSLDKTALKWLDDKDDKFTTGAFYEDDGQKNMDVIEKYIQANGKTWETFPFFKWCRDHGDGWYAPASDELKDILNTINGGEGKYNSKFMKKVAKSLKKAKGDGLINGGYMGSKLPFSMYSSTEGDGGMVYTLYMKESVSSMLVRSSYSSPKGKFVVELMLKTHTGGKFANAFGSRAVHKF